MNYPFHRLFTIITILIGLVFLPQSAYSGSFTCWLQFKIIAPLVPSLVPKQAAARRLILGLRADIESIKALEKNGKPFQAANLGEQFEKHMLDQDEGANQLVDRIGALEMSNPGKREAVERLFYPRIEDELKRLSTAQRTQLLGWLSMTPNSKETSGIYTPIASANHTDPVFSYLGASNEARAFGDKLSKYALTKLVEESNVDSWQYIVMDALSYSLSANWSRQQIADHLGEDTNVRVAILNAISSQEKLIAANEGKLKKEQEKDKKWGLRQDSGETVRAKDTLKENTRYLEKLRQLLT